MTNCVQQTLALQRKYLHCFTDKRRTCSVSSANGRQHRCHWRNPRWKNTTHATSLVLFQRRPYGPEPHPVELANHIDRKLSLQAGEGFTRNKSALHVGDDFKSLSVWDPQTFSGPAVFIYLFIYLCTIAKCPSRGLWFHKEKREPWKQDWVFLAFISTNVNTNVTFT